MRRFGFVAVAFGLLMVVAQVVGTGTIAVAQGPSLGLPGAINGGFGSPGAMQPPMGSRTPSARGRGRPSAFNGPNGNQNQAGGRVNYMGAMGRSQNVINQTGARTSKQFQQNAKQVQRPLTNYSF